MGKLIEELFDAVFVTAKSIEEIPYFEYFALVMIGACTVVGFLMIPEPSIIWSIFFGLFTAFSGFTFFMIVHSLISKNRRNAEINRRKEEFQRMREWYKIEGKKMTNEILLDFLERIMGMPDAETNYADGKFTEQNTEIVKVYSAIDKYEEVLQQVKELRKDKLNEVEKREKLEVELESEKKARSAVETLIQELYSELAEVKKKLDSKMDK